MLTLAVMGNPIAHSLSPIIHQTFAVQSQLNISYEKLLIPVDRFETELTTFFRNGKGFGCNITVPFKERAFLAVQDCTEEARYAKAVNTIKKDQHGRLIGHNTDGIGLVQDLRNKSLKLRDNVVLILGAGGATRGIIWPLLNAGVSQILIANRTSEKAEALAKDINDIRCRAVSPEQLTSFSPTLMINATSSSLNDRLPDIELGCLASCEAVYDMVYDIKPTAFMQYASDAGVKHTYDGLGMLVEQAAAAFFWWTGCQVSTADILTSLREKMSNG